MLDVIILSNAKNFDLFKMTVETVYSLLESNSDVTIFILEQNEKSEYRFRNEKVKVFFINEKFNYNKFANIGARLGHSEYICIANNDLLFEPNWFREILKANYPICSPRCPVDIRQKNVVANEIGEEVGRHLSGWCFVMKRTLWQDIDGFDEDFSFWCADNSLMEQLLAIDIKPMLVRNSIVEHLGSKTLKTVDNRDELTIDQVRKFNKKYNKNLFGWGV